ncbi:anti-sigma factor [Burkholderia sp. L27(2015)]|uniref:anti-sigma factor family protein n=1 Tax=Burkholderia sp. L27(2015) TaxID=1641858 RepID=UPI00131C56B5|nr:anti-sigma factor [Burkholderia sp. L27(2015)]
MNRKNDPVTEDDLHAYVDDLLSEHRREDVDRMLASNAEAKRRVNHNRMLNEMIRERHVHVLREPVPPRLQLTSKRRWFDAANMPRFAGMAAALLLGIGIGTHVLSMFPQGGDEDGVAHLIADDGLAGFARQSALAHVMYSPDVERPALVDPQHERDLGKWVSGKLGTDVVPPVLMHAGYKLMGGRLLPGREGPFVQFTYNGEKGERVTLCISRRKTDGTVTTGFALYKDGPVKVFHWMAGNYGYAVTGGIDRAALLQVARDVQSDLAANSAAPPAGAPLPTTVN